MGRFLAVAGRPLATAVFLLAGLLAPRFLSPGSDHLVWTAGLILLGAPILWTTIRGMLAGRFAADLVASLALVTAVVLDDPLPGLVIVLMQSGGESLEHLAARRASRAVAELEAQAPRVAHRVAADGIRDIPVADVAVGDRLVVRPGEMVPCNGIVREGRSSLDTSRITGEPLPRSVTAGVAVASGTVNIQSPITIEATARAEGSLYHQIVELVRTAQESKAHLQRLADRAAVWFTPITILACVAAYLASGDSTRVLAVLVVATPCPLILAAPVAMLGGISRSARHQIIVRHGTALEQLARVDTAVFDKTGTLTLGHPVVERVDPIGERRREEILRLAAAVEQGSVTAGAAGGRRRVRGARGARRQPGRRSVGTRRHRPRRWAAGHDRRPHAAPRTGLLAARLRRRIGRAGAPGLSAVDGEAAYTITYADRLRPTAYHRRTPSAGSVWSASCCCRAIVK
ncbi:MAG: HAD-IC family P-type ATPase [Gemmatimonadales bacterium]